MSAPRCALTAVTTDAFGGTTGLTSAAQTVARTLRTRRPGRWRSAGRLRRGRAISADTSGLSDVDGGIANTTYQWQIDTGSGFADIGGATDATLNIPADQSYVGAQVRLTAVTTDAFGGTTGYTSAAQTVARTLRTRRPGRWRSAARLRKARAISADTSGLSDVDGGIANTTYQWQIDTGSGFADIGGATSATLNIPGDQSYVGAQVRLTAVTTDAFGGTTGLTSAAQTVANVEDEATGTLGISGTVEEGASISANTSGLSDVDGGIANTTYQWQIDTGSGFADIGGATGATLNIPSDQSYVGAQVRVTAITTDAFGGTTSHTSAAQTVANVEDEATGTLGISGTVEEGASISANTSGLSDVDGGIANTTYQWQIDTGSGFADIGGATGATLNIPSDQSYVGAQVRVTAITTDAFGGTTSHTSAAQTVANVEDEATGTLGISGTVEEGASISANTSGLSDVDGGIANTTYQWQIDTGSGFADIGGATNATLNIPATRAMSAPRCA